MPDRSGDDIENRNLPSLRRRFSPAVSILILTFLLPSAASAATLSEARKLYETGDYAGCIEACKLGTEANRWFEEWWLLKIRSELTTGAYAEAFRTFEAAHQIHTFSLSLKWAGVEVLRRTGRADEATALLKSIRDLAEAAPRRLEEVSARVAAGRAMLATGADARVVLENYFDRARKDDPSSAEPYLAAGELSLSKYDFALAAEAFAGAIRRAPENPDAHLGLALAYQESDAERATASLAKALEVNPKHVDSLLFQADNLIDREGYDPAEELLRKVLEINPRHWRAWSYRAVLAHLLGDRTKEQMARAEALSTWGTNPEVDNLIGQKLSQKYRFAEGATYQRRSLEIAPAFQPANVQLCQDLLRLGKDEEGWKRAAAALDADPYNVVAYNLVALDDVLRTYRVLSNPHFRVRMDPREADLYGDRAVQLLTRAKKNLARRYNIDISEPVSIEIFPRQSDFAIRTFGLPGGSGFLGVCFGPVITVNSPASRMARPSNWEAVLWHEFCHTVTLGKTKNKMPRWLSEGISVYEERRENPAWGQAMTPEYRTLILDGGATPVSQLSGAFLRPPSPMHLQFAYYQSSMVVQYIVERFGESAIGKVLTELASDVRINDALAKHTEPMEKLDAGFAEWFKKLAEDLGTPGTDWRKPEVPLDADSSVMAAWNKANPNSFYGLLGEGRALLAEEKFAAARAPLTRAIALHAGYAEAGGPYLLMAAVHRALKESADERRMLEKHVALDADGIEPRLRLAELAEAAGDWKAVGVYADQILAINPLIPGPHQLLVKAAEATGDSAGAIRGLTALLVLDPLGRAEHHYKLARLCFAQKELPAARNQIIRALEEAPRYREAHQLLLEIAKTMETTTTKPTTTPAPATLPSR